MYHGKAQPRALAGPLRREERLCRASQRFGVHARAGVADHEADVAAGREPKPLLGFDGQLIYRDGQGTAIRHGVARVYAKVQESELQLGRICVGARERQRNVERDPDVRFNGAGDEVGHAMDQRADADGTGAWRRAKS